MHNVPTLEQRVDKVEQDLQTFNTRLATLIWLCGILAAMGLTGGVLSGWFQHTVKESTSDIQERRKEIAALNHDEAVAKSSLLEIQAKVTENQQIVGTLDQIVNDKKKELRKYAETLGPASKNDLKKAPASRALDQVQALQTFVPKEPYYTAGYNEDVGQLLNCVDLYLSELKVKSIPLDFQSNKPF